MKIRFAVTAAGVMAMGVAATAGAEDSVQAMASGTKPILDLRLRMENVDQDGIAEDAHATTLRAKLGFESGKAWGTTVLAEVEGILPLQNEYRPDPLRPVNTQYPVVPDAEGYEVNRLQISNSSLPGTTFTLGRQRILLDDHRFVGNVGWRQNEQTFDALRVVNKSVKNLTLDATYFTKVNRIFGEDSPQGDYKGDSALLNAGYQFKAGKLVLFNYLLDFEPVAGVPAAARDSTNTWGVRFTGEAPAGPVKIAYAGSYATQKDYAGNPLDFDLDYLFAEAGVTYKVLTLGYGVEILEGNGAKGFTTPLATLHKFQGWADKFLATPVNGIQDSYAFGALALKKVGPLDTLTLNAAWHEFEAEAVDLDYGDELNLSLAAKIRKVNLLLKFADYQGGIPAAGRDTQKLWAQVEFVW